MTEAVAWMYRFGANDPVILPSKRDWADNNPKWTETPLYPAEALRARDERIAELERERDALSGLVQGWHYLAVGPDEMGDYHTQKQLIKLSEPYASPALKALKEKNDDA